MSEKKILKNKEFPSFLNSLAKDLIKYYYSKLDKKFKVSNKLKGKGYDPVTTADTAFEKFIRSKIGKKFPNHEIIGEEYGHKKSKSDFTWIIDPIDGTRSFVIGNPTWSNLVALNYKGTPIVGLANFPELNKYYINDKKKSYLFKNNKKFILKSSNNNNLKTIKIIGNFHGTLSYEKQRRVIKKFGWSFRLAGFDALNYCLLAEGTVDAVIEANLKPYDILPLIPIIKNSGAIVTNWKNEPAENGGNILATSNKVLHTKILKLLKPFTKKS
jgi:myo-inositol-1(or 4)-monophosphatase